MSKGEEEKEIRQVRREERLKKKREQIKRHGGSIARVYRDAVTKRLKEKQKEGGK